MPKGVEVSAVPAGEKIKNASLNFNDARARLNTNAKAYFGKCVNFGDLTVHVHYNSDSDIHVVIPNPNMVKAVLDGTTPYAPPAQYNELSPSFIDPIEEKEKAYHFRLGDYVFTQCG